MSEENKAPETEAAESVVEATPPTTVDPNEREQRQGRRERGPKNEQRREREDKSSPFLERVVTINRVPRW